MLIFPLVIPFLMMCKIFKPFGALLEILNQLILVNYRKNSIVFYLNEQYKVYGIRQQKRKKKITGRVVYN